MGTINLVYLSKTNNLGFFENIRNINNEIIKFKKDDAINEFNEYDEREVQRGASCAVFPELKTTKHITIQDLKQGLKTRGVKDEIFQNKILSLLIQSRVGVVFPLVAAILMLFGNDKFFVDTSSNNIELNVKNNGLVRLVYSGTLNGTTQENAFKVRIEVDITPHKAAVSSFTIKQVAYSDEAKLAFNFLKDNQVSIFQQFILWIKSFFSYNKDFEIENEARDNLLWAQNTKRGGATEVEFEIPGDVDEDSTEHISALISGAR